MRRFPSLPFVLLVAGLATASACTVGSPSTPFGQGAVHDDMGHAVETAPDLGGADLTAPLTPPQLATYSQTSVWTTVPLHGTTSPPNSSVIITAMDGSQTSADVDGSGRFCANLALVAGTTNTFQLKTHDNNSGNESASVAVQVTQSGSPSGPEAQSAQNASNGGSGTVYQIGVNGSASAQQLTDGDPSTAAEGPYDSGWTTYPNAGVLVQLNATSSINQIIAVLPSDCPITATLVLAYSAQATPDVPGDNAQGWITVPATQSADGWTWTATFSPATAMYIAAWWTGESWWEGVGLGGCGTAGNYFGLAELQGWTAPGVQQPPQTAPTCGL